MVGGGSKMSKIQKSISNYMNGSDLVDHMDPETLVVKGAQMYGEKNSNQVDENMIYNKNTLLDMGIEIEGGFLQVIIPRDMEIPNKRKI